MERKNLNDAEENVRKDLQADHRAAKDGIHLKPGQNVVKPEDPGDGYRNAVSTHIYGLRKEGHGPQWHLDPIDQVLKDRLGVPALPRMVDNELEYPHIAGGYVQSGGGGGVHACGSGTPDRTSSRRAR